MRGGLALAVGRSPLAAPPRRWRPAHAVDRTRSRPELGHTFEFRSTIVNRGATPTPPLIAHLNVLSLGPASTSTPRTGRRTARATCGRSRRTARESALADDRREPGTRRRLRRPAPAPRPAGGHDRFGGPGSDRRPEARSTRARPCPSPSACRLSSASSCRGFGSGAGGWTSAYLELRHGRLQAVRPCSTEIGTDACVTALADSSGGWIPLALDMCSMSGFEPVRHACSAVIGSAARDCRRCCRPAGASACA